MKKKIVQRIYIFLFVAIALAACKKENLQQGPGEQDPNQPAETFTIRLQAVVTVGSITYDSIPAQCRIISWDANNVAHQKDRVLDAGVNTVAVPKAHTRFRFIVNKWGIADTVTLTKQQVQEDVVYTLGGSKPARRLRKEESFLYVIDTYQPSSRIQYAYNNKGISAIEFYQKKPQSSELKFTHRHLYNYSGSNVSRIDVFDETNTATGFTEFSYNAQGTKILHMQQKAYDVETYAALEYSYPTGAAAITIDYLYNNGNAMEYTMKIDGGNKIEDRAISSTGGSESGTYKYDFNINPFVHMNMPNIFLSNLSKNNLAEEQKNYSGSIPVAVLYNIEYTYDSEGYPTEVVKHYKGFQSGDHLYKIKTVYTYM